MAQEQNRRPIYNKRVTDQQANPLARSGPGVNVYCPVFATLLEDIKAIDPSRELDSLDSLSSADISSCSHIISVSSRFHGSEDKRRQAVLESLASVLRTHFTKEVASEGGKKTRRAQARSDALSRADNMGMDFMLEFKLEDGIGGDAVAQNSFAWRKHVVADNVSIKFKSTCQALMIRLQYKHIRDVSCCPTILIAMIGSRMDLSLGVLADIFIVQHVTSIQLSHASKPDLFSEVYQTFTALRKAGAALKAYYAGLPVNPNGFNPCCALPSPTFNMPLDQAELQFQDRLDFHSRHRTQDYHRALFRAQLRLPNCTKNVVVKIVDTYNADAHRLLADAGLAPSLYLFERLIGGGYIVAMDIVDGSSAAKLLDGKRLPSRASMDIEDALRLLHASNFVFGDLVLDNIILAPDPGTRALRAKLVDFDGVGTANATRYSPFLAELDNGVGISRGVVMTTAQDMGMFDLIKAVPE